MGWLRETFVGDGPSRADLQEQLDQERRQSSHLQESLSDIERSTTSDAGWRRMGAEYDREFSRAGLDDIVTLARAMYMSYPLIQRAVNITAYYTWGQGFSVKAEDDRVQELIDELMENPVNLAELYDHQAQVLTDIDLMNDGNVFLSLETDAMGGVEVHTLPVEEIREIYTKPGNPHQPWFYRRRWVEETLDLATGAVVQEAKEALYPDWRHWPDNRPDSAGSIPILWSEPVVHQKAGGLKGMKFGVPISYSAFEWARAYKKFLEDWHTLVASLAKFAWQVTTKTKNISKVRQKLDADYSETDGVRNRARATGSAAVTDEDTTLTPISKSGATTSAEDAKPSRLMVASAMNIPDTILSNDPQQGALATAKTLDRPTELYIVNRQSAWKSAHDAIVQYAILAKQRRAQLPDDLETAVEISFPTVLEHDLTETVGAIVSAATLDGKETAGTIPSEIVNTMLMEALGVDNVEQALEQLDKEDAARVEQLTKDMDEFLRQQQNNPPPAPPQQQAPPPPGGAS